MVELKLRKSQEFTPPADTTVEMNPLGSPGESDHVVALDQIDFVPNLDSKPDTPTGPFSPVLSHQPLLLPTQHLISSLISFSRC